MEKRQTQTILDGLIESLAAVEHERWAHWQRYLHSKCSRKADGSLLLPAELVQKWEKQIATKYEDLGEEQKESDRDQVRRYLPLIAAALTEQMQERPKRR